MEFEILNYFDILYSQNSMKWKKNLKRTLQYKANREE